MRMLFEYVIKPRRFVALLLLLFRYPKTNSLFDKYLLVVNVQVLAHFNRDKTGQLVVKSTGVQQYQQHQLEVHLIYHFQLLNKLK